MYDLIVIDPPTISRSKKMTDLFNVQVDYIFLISKAVKLLNKEGVIFFSTNSRKFVFDASHFPSCQSKEISHQTLSIDFHDPKIHRCWKISLT
jgi:23S rRNA (cytosine1962-C5)-methyltransferase